MPTAHNELSRFQTLLLNTLFEQSDPESILRLLQEHPDSYAFLDWLESMDPAMVELGAGLVKKWALRDLGDGAD